MRLSPASRAAALKLRKCRSTWFPRFSTNWVTSGQWEPMRGARCARVGGRRKRERARQREGRNETGDASHFAVLQSMGGVDALVLCQLQKRTGNLLRHVADGAGIVYTRVSSVAPEHLRRLHPGLGDGPSTTLYGHSAPMAQRAAVARSRGRQSLRARRWRARRRAGSSPAICSAKLLRATSPY